MLAAPTTLYPRIQSGPWSQPDPSGPEPAYGQDISEAPVVGEYAEVQASLDRDFGLERSLREHVPSSMSSVGRAGASGGPYCATGSPNPPGTSASPVGAGGGEAGGAPNSNQGGRGSEPSAKSNRIKRRLV